MRPLLEFVKGVRVRIVPVVWMCFAFHHRGQQPMKNARLLVALLLVGLSSERSEAKFLQVETEQVPIARLIANLEKQWEQNPDDRQLHYALGRVHSMAYALDSASIQVEQKTGKPWFVYFDNGAPPRQGTERNAPAQEKEAKAHLREAIEHYEAAAQISPGHLASLVRLA